MEELKKLKETAYYNIFKIMAVNQWGPMQYLELEKFKAQLRTGLSISAEQHEQILNKLGQDVQRFGDALEQGGAGKRARPDGFAKAAAPAAKRPALAKAALPKAQKASAAPGAPLRLNEYLGRRVKMYWPEEGGWFEAIITDYNMAENEHCLTYNMNTGNESFEWVNIASLRDNEFKWIAGPAVNLDELLPKGAARGAAGRSRPAQPAHKAAPAPGGALQELEQAVKRAKDPKKLEEIQGDLAQKHAALQAELAQLSSDEEEEARGGGGGGGGGQEASEHATSVSE